MEQTCPKCQRVYPATARYCSECGTCLTGPSGASEDASAGAASKSYISRLLPQQYIERLSTTGGDVRSERRIVTTLFADIVDSTALAEALDPEDVTDIVNGAFRILTEPIISHDGTLARLMGDAVLGLFGAPVAHEDDPIRACRAAMDMLKETTNYSTELQQRFGIPFQIRVGISTGLAVVGEVGTADRSEYTAIGDAVNLAARLQSYATPGTAAVDGRTQTLIRDEIAVSDKGVHVFKGKTEAIHVYELRPDVQVRRERGAQITDTSFINRDSEMQLLQEWLRDLALGKGVTIQITGAAGIGKSRMLSEMQHRLQECRWIVGHGQSSMRDSSYWVMRELLSQLFEFDPNDLTVESVDSVRRHLDTCLQSGSSSHDATAETVAILHVLHIPLTNSERSYFATCTPDVRSRAIRDAAISILRCEASQQSCVLVWDDAQWMDPESRELLDAICTLTASLPIAVIVVSRDHSGLGETTAEAETHSLIVAPLTEEDSRALIAHAADDVGISAAVQNRILTIAEGNPLCLEEMVHTVMSGGGADGTEPRVSSLRNADQIDVPVSVQAAILARIDQLPSCERSILQIASVIGRTIQPDVLHLAIHPHISLEAFGRGLERLQRDALLVPATETQNAIDKDARPEFSSAVRLTMQSRLRARSDADIDQQSDLPPLIFKQATMVEVIYQSLLKSERREMHRRIGSILESLFPGKRQRMAPTLSYHFRKGDVPDKALEYLILTADRAFDLCSLSQALSCYTQSLSIITDQVHDAKVATRAHILIRLGDVHRLRGNYSEALDRYEQAMPLLTSSRERASLFYCLGRVHEKSGRLSEAQTAFEDGIDCVKGELDERELAKLYLGLSAVFCRRGQLEEARDIGELALGVAERVGEQRDEALARSNLGICLAKMDQRQAAREYYTEAESVFAAIADHYGLAVLLNNLGCLCKDECDWSGADESFNRSLQLFTKLGNEHACARVHNNLSDTFYLAGREDEAHLHLERAMAILAVIGADSSGPIPEMWQAGTW